MEEGTNVSEIRIRCMGSIDPLYAFRAVGSVGNNYMKFGAQQEIVNPHQEGKNVFVEIGYPENGVLYIYVGYTKEVK